MTCLSKSLILTSNESVLSIGRFALLLVGAFPDVLLNADSFFIVTSYALNDVFSPSTVLYLFLFLREPGLQKLFLPLLQQRQFGVPNRLYRDSLDVLLSRVHFL